jgi:hypothetical protein
VGGKFLAKSAILHPPFPRPPLSMPAAAVRVDERLTKALDLVFDKKVGRQEVHKGVLQEPAQEPHKHLTRTILTSMSVCLALGGAQRPGLLGDLGRGGGEPQGPPLLL